MDPDPLTMSENFPHVGDIQNETDLRTRCAALLQQKQPEQDLVVFTRRGELVMEIDLESIVGLYHAGRVSSVQLVAHAIMDDLKHNYH
jgi:hypothetical protein